MEHQLFTRSCAVHEVAVALFSLVGHARENQEHYSTANVPAQKLCTLHRSTADHAGVYYGVYVRDGVYCQPSPAELQHPTHPAPIGEQIGNRRCAGHTQDGERQGALPSQPTATRYPPTRALRSFCEHLHGKDSWLTCSIAAIKPEKATWGPNGGRIFLHLSRGTFLCTLRLPTSKSSRATSAL